MSHRQYDMWDPGGWNAVRVESVTAQGLSPGCYTYILGRGLFHTFASFHLFFWIGFIYMTMSSNVYYISICPRVKHSGDESIGSWHVEAAILEGILVCVDWNDIIKLSMICCSSDRHD